MTIPADIRVSLSEPGGDLRRVTAAARRLDVHGLHLDWRDLRRVLDREGIDIMSLDRGPVSVDGVRIAGVDTSALSAESVEEMERQTDDIYMQMRVCRDLGLGEISLRSGACNAIARELFADGLRRLAALADRLELRILLRNARDTCLQTTDDVDRALNDAAADNVMVDADTGAFHSASVNPCDPLRSLGDLVGVVRLWDVSRESQTALGRGEINAGAVVQAIAEHCADAAVVVRMGGDGEAEVRLEEDIRFLRANLD